jgi:hypothetical protein
MTLGDYIHDRDSSPTQEGNEKPSRYCEKHRMRLEGWEICFRCVDEVDALMASTETVELFHAVDQIQVTKTTKEKPKA